MNVPDILIGIAGIGLLFSILPGIIENFRDRKARNFMMSTLIAAMLTLVVAAYIMLGTMFGAIVTGIQVSLWVVLAIQAKLWGTN